MSFAFNTVRLNGSLLGGITSPSFDRREQQNRRGDDGQIHQTAASVIRAAPMASFETVAARALAVILGTGDEVPFVALDGTNGLELLGLKANTAGPGYASGSVHARRKGAVGQLFLGGLSWSPANELRARANAYFVSSDGTTDPCPADTTTAPTIPVNTERLVLSTLTLAGDAVTACSSFDLTIDHKAENNIEPLCFDKGLPYPKAVHSAGINGPSDIALSLDVLDMTTAFTATGTVVAVFTALNHLGVGIASNTLTVTLANCTIREETGQGSEGGGAGSRRIVCRPTYNGSTLPLALTTA